MTDDQAGHNHAIEIQASLNLGGDAAAMPVSHAGAVTVTGTRVSRDEMNLAEFPLTVLSKRVDPSVKTLEFSDTVKGKNGELVNRAWIITGADKFGLPTSSDDEVLLGLLKLTADDGVRDRKVHFTRYELLKILRWTTEGRSYTRLQNALDRLSGVRIKATNAFYDNESKLHSTRNFGIIDEYEINDGRDTRPSFFTWSEVLFKSFQVGFIKKLDLDFYLDLRSAVSKRLYRYLDKHFWYRSRIQINLFTLAHEKIGISRNYVYASSLRQQLEPALEELVEKGLLAEFEFIGKGQSTEVVLLATQGARRPNMLPPKPSHSNDPHVTAPQNTSAVNVSAVGKRTEGGDPPAGAKESLVTALVERGIVERQARRILEGKDAQALSRVKEILQHYDALVASRSHLVSKNPCGFLYRAVERPFDFVLPSDKAAGIRRPNDSQFAAAPNRTRQLQRAQKADRASLEAAYLTQRSKALSLIKAKTRQAEIQSLRSEVETALARLRSSLSPQRFQEAVEHGVEQRLLDKESFPDFDRWCREQGAQQAAER
jgi:hypothetical protein